jgi:CBS domain-containing protein
MDFGRLIGILTERDLLAAVAGRVQANEARVREWMTEKPGHRSRGDADRKSRERHGDARLSPPADRRR